MSTTNIHYSDSKFQVIYKTADLNAGTSGLITKGNCNITFAILPFVSEKKILELNCHPESFGI